jgi:hypothetical protein
MKRFRVEGMECYFKNGKIVTESNLRDTLGGWVEHGWEGDVETFNETFHSWRIQRVVKRYMAVKVGSGWFSCRLKSGDVFSKKELKELWNVTLKNWNGSTKDLNYSLSHLGNVPNREVKFKKIFVQIDDK